MSYDSRVDSGARIELHYNNLNKNFAELEKKDDFEIKIKILNEINKLIELLPPEFLAKHKELKNFENRIFLPNKQAEKEWKEKIGPAIKGIIPTKEETIARLEEEMKDSGLEPKPTQPSQTVSEKSELEESIDDVEEEEGKSDDEDLDISILDRTITPPIKEKLITENEKLIKENIDILRPLLNDYKLLLSDKDKMEKNPLEIDAALIDLHKKIAEVVKKLRAIFRELSEPLTTATLTQYGSVLQEAKNLRTPGRESKNLVTLADFLNATVRNYRTKDKKERVAIGSVIKQTLRTVAATIKNSKFNDLKQLVESVSSAKLSKAQLETIEDISLKMTLVSEYLKMDEAKATTDAEVTARAKKREKSVIEAMNGLNNLLEDYKESAENRFIYLKLVQIREFSSDKQTQSTVNSILTNFPFNKTLSKATLKSIKAFIEALAKELEKA